MNVGILMIVFIRFDIFDLILCIHTRGSIVVP